MYIRAGSCCHNAYGLSRCPICRQLRHTNSPASGCSLSAFPSRLSAACCSACAIASVERCELVPGQTPVSTVLDGYAPRSESCQGRNGANGCKQRVFCGVNRSIATTCVSASVATAAHLPSYGTPAPVPAGHLQLGRRHVRRGALSPVPHVQKRDGSSSPEVSAAHLVRCQLALMPTAVARCERLGQRLVYANRPWRDGSVQVYAATGAAPLLLTWMNASAISAWTLRRSVVDPMSAAVPAVLPAGLDPDREPDRAMCWCENLGTRVRYELMCTPNQQQPSASSTNPRHKRCAHSSTAAALRTGQYTWSTWTRVCAQRHGVEAERMYASLCVNICALSRCRTRGSPAARSLLVSSSARVHVQSCRALDSLGVLRLSLHFGR